MDQVLFSPAFQQDGTAFALGSDQLYRTIDGGATWTNLDPGQGQIMVAAALSPNFNVDHTLWAASVSARPSRQSQDPAPTDNADSAGLLVSQDAGTTWSSLSDGLQTDDGPYHQVLSIGVSPKFGTDQTLFVTALGPWPFDGCNRSSCATPTVGTFQGNDGGASWQLVDKPQRSLYVVDAALNLSPAFGVDQTLMSTLTSGGYSPSTGGCSAVVSADAGRSWQRPRATGSGASLCGMGSQTLAGPQFWSPTSIRTTCRRVRTITCSDR
jgi:hypothetical protein